MKANRWTFEVSHLIAESANLDILCKRCDLCCKSCNCYFLFLFLLLSVCQLWLFSWFHIIIVKKLDTWIQCQSHLTWWGCDDGVWHLELELSSQQPAACKPHVKSRHKQICVYGPTCSLQPCMLCVFYPSAGLLVSHADGHSSRWLIETKIESWLTELQPESYKSAWCIYWYLFWFASLINHTQKWVYE